MKYTLEIPEEHPDGDIVLVLEASFRGDIRKIIEQKDPEADVGSREDAERAVATNLFNVIAAIITSNSQEGDGGEAADGATETEDGEALK